MNSKSTFNPVSSECYRPCVWSVGSYDSVSSQSWFCTKSSDSGTDVTRATRLSVPTVPRFRAHSSGEVMRKELGRSRTFPSSWKIPRTKQHLQPGASKAAGAPAPHTCRVGISTGRWGGSRGVSRHSRTRCVSGGCTRVALVGVSGPRHGRRTAGAGPTAQRGYSGRKRGASFRKGNRSGAACRRRV